MVASMCDLRKERAGLEKCQYCVRAFREEDYPKHMAWKRRHAELAEEEGSSRVNGEKVNHRSVLNDHYAGILY